MDKLTKNVFYIIGFVGIMFAGGLQSFTFILKTEPDPFIMILNGVTLIALGGTFLINYLEKEGLIEVENGDE